MDTITRLFDLLAVGMLIFVGLGIAGVVAYFRFKASGQERGM